MLKKLIGYACRLSILAGLLGGCAKDESIPTVRSSAGLSMDGAHHVSIEGAPDLITTTIAIDSTLAPGGWSTAPLPLPKPNGFAIGSRNGRIFIFDRHDSLTQVIHPLNRDAIDELLVDSTTLYAIDVQGFVSAFEHSGKLLWSVGGIGTLTAPAILAGRVLVLGSGNRIAGLDANSGKTLWVSNSNFSLAAIAYATGRRLVMLGLTNGTSGASDSIFFLSAEGRERSKFGLSNLQLTSNIAIVEKDGTTLVFGALGEANGGRRQAELVAMHIGESGAVTTLWKHPVPYLVANVALNGTTAFASGARTLDNEFVSGIDAFQLWDTTTLWQRRFTEPLVSIPAASDANVYFTMNFESEAIVGSRGLFLTLSAGDGRTTSQRPLKGAVEGAFPGMPMPDEEGRFLVADRARPIVFILDRSTLKRVF